jgi:lipoprotein-anchoring transpeptidase ErfK/SrfK
MRFVVPGRDSPTAPAVPYNYRQIYGAMPQEKFSIPAVDLSRVPQRFWRRVVPYRSPYPVGSVIVDTRSFLLHLVRENDMAIRYGVGLGRQGFEWSGRGVIQWKQAWPKWTPPDEMIERQPELAKWSADNGGMPPGLDNPLGARALYIFQNGEDTLYRIHGSPEYWTIGKAVSSGCVRMINQDVIDLYNRVTNGAALIVT